jgi:hypothetical protein
MAKSKYPSTYEQAVALALLKARVIPSLITLRFAFTGTPDERQDFATFALRRLRVRAGLTP